MAVVGSGGTNLEVPGFFVESFTIQAIGGNITLTNVPVVVLDVTNPADPGNVVDGIVGTNLLAGRNVVIDPKPSLGGGGVGPEPLHQRSDHDAEELDDHRRQRHLRHRRQLERRHGADQSRHRQRAARLRRQSNRRRRRERQRLGTQRLRLREPIDDASRSIAVSR